MIYLYNLKVFQALIIDVFLEKNDVLILEKLLLLSVPLNRDKRYFDELVSEIGFGGFYWLVKVSYTFSGRYRTRLHKLMLYIFSDMLYCRCDPGYLEIFFNFFYNTMECHGSLVFKCFKMIKDFYSRQVVKYIDDELDWNLYFKVLLSTDNSDSLVNGYCGLVMLLKHNLVQLSKEDVSRIMMLASDNEGVFLGEVAIECLYHYLKCEDYGTNQTRVGVVLDLSSDFTFFSSMLENSSFKTIMYLGKIFVFLINSSFNPSDYKIFNNVIVFKIFTDIVRVGIEKIQLSLLECLDKLYSRFCFMNSLDQYYLLINEVNLKETLIELSTSSFDQVAHRAFCLKTKLFDY